MFSFVHPISASVTLRSRRNVSTIDRTPRPTLREVRTYFCISLHQYLERRYIPNLDSFLALCEEYTTKEYVQDRVVLAEKLYNRFLDSQSPELIHTDPLLIRSYLERYRQGMEQGDMPNDLFDDLMDFVKERLEELLPEYFASKDFHQACRKYTGFLWRIIKLSRLAYRLCSLLLDKVMAPLLLLFESDQLSCVPNLSPHSFKRFHEMSQLFNDYIHKLKRRLNLIGYLSKEMCMRETIRESHATRALHTGVQTGEAGSQRTNRSMRNYRITRNY